MLPAMYARRRWVIVFFVVAFLMARLTGAHLHLCFDGSEPPAQLHVSDDAEIHHHADDPQSHDDLDVDVLDDVLAKVAKHDSTAVALVVWCLTLLLVAVVLQPARSAIWPPPLRPPRFLRPLLRAPPV
jgi:hypothetical protein